MNDMLIRGLRTVTRQKIERLAHTQNLSMNQILLAVVDAGIERLEKKTEEERRQDEAFSRLEKIRDEISRKYGKFDESWKLIREDRDSR